MSSLIVKLKNSKVILVVLSSFLILVSLPIIEVMIKVIFSYGNYFGSLARYIYEGKICLGFA